jgi:uncharacterized protein (TIRG00374 family)
LRPDRHRDREEPYASVPPTIAGEGEDMPRVVFTRRRMLLFGLFIIAVVAFLYFVLPNLGGQKNKLRASLQQINGGDPWWLALALLLEAGSYAGYMTFFRGVFARGNHSLGWRESYQITMAGVAATRLFAAAGAGGVALTAWAVRRSGMEARLVACRMVAFIVVLYGVFMLTLIVVGLGLASGLFAGDHPFAMTIVPALFGAAVIVLFLAISLLPQDFERRLQSWASGRGRTAQLARRLATAPASLASGVRTAIGLVRRGEPGLLGALAWWACDIACLWACFKALYGAGPPTGVVVMAYFVGSLGNILPIPGGVGGVEAATSAAFAAFGTDFGHALGAVLTWRVFNFWLPTVPGIIAYAQLRKTIARWGSRPVSAAKPGVTT